jgi:hypothetical protein
MRLRVIPVRQLVVTGLNASGEELKDWDTSRSIIGKIAPGSSSEIHSVNREEELNTITIYCATLYRWLKSNDELVIDGEIWKIEGRPQLWENQPGYRSVTVITAKYVEG